MNIFDKIFGKKKLPNFNDHGENIVASIAKCKHLYKKLVILAHPDKHPEKTELAEEITKAINMARYNYAELLKLENRIETELR